MGRESALQFSTKFSPPHQCHSTKVHPHLGNARPPLGTQQRAKNRPFGCPIDDWSETYRCVPTCLRYAIPRTFSLRPFFADAPSRQHRDPSSSTNAPRNSALGFVFTLDDKRRSCTKLIEKFGYQHQL